MLIPRLCEYADRYLDLPPAMYQMQPIRYLVDLDLQGRFLGVIDTRDASSAATKRGAPRLAPHLKRANGIRPKLLADTGVYVFGIPGEKDRPERAREQKEAFDVQVRACADATGEDAVRAVVKLLESAEESPLALPADLDPGAQLTFRVGGVLPIDLSSVRAYWARLKGADEDDEAGSERMQCVGCGQLRRPLQRHPLKVKGIRVGQTGGTDLVSANSKAFESYGLENSLIAPTCQGCGEKYANALNALLANPETHLHVAGVEYVFWSAEPSGFSPTRFFSQPDPVEVQALMRAAESGRQSATAVDETAFYALALGASGSRVAVLVWIDTTVGQAMQHMARYFALQELVQFDGTESEPLPIWRLAGATVRDPRKERPPATVPESLLRLALGGSPLPLDLLFQAVRRNRAEQGVTRERAMLIKMVLGSQSAADEGGTKAMTELDAGSREPAYLCGRLLAVLDAVQRRALNNPNATIVDRYYGAASSAPASVFGTLLHGAQPHLAKMRKNPGSHGAYLALERRLEEVMEGLATFPATLSLKEQGLFALGFYHQRAADRRARRDRAEERAAEQEADATVG